MNQTIIQERSGLNQFYAKVYSFVGLGIALSAIVSALMLTTFQDLLVQLMLNARIWLIVTGIVEVALVIFASGLAAKNSPATLPMFLLYSVVNGFSLSYIVSLYLPGTVLTAFISSAALFFVMAIIGVVIKKDLSGIGRALIAALFGLILAMVVNIFLNSGFMDYIISIVMVIVFAGLIAWDNQKIRYIYEESDGQASTGWAIAIALSLYLDFINLFLSFLRIFGSDD